MNIFLYIWEAFRWTCLYKKSSESRELRKNINLYKNKINSPLISVVSIMHAVHRLTLQARSETVFQSTYWFFARLERTSLANCLWAVRCRKSKRLYCCCVYASKLVEIFTTGITITNNGGWNNPDGFGYIMRVLCIRCVCFSYFF